MRLVTPVLSAAVCKSSRIRHSPNSGTVRRFPVLPTPCAKTAKSYAFCDSLPVSASVCVFAFDTGVLVLWLEAFGRSRLYRCQSTPGPPMPCFVAQSFAFAVFATLICQINSVFLCKGTKLKNSAKPNSWIVCFELWHRASFWQPLQPWFVKETAFFFAKAQNSGIRLVPDSGTGCRFYAQSLKPAQSLKIKTIDFKGEQKVYCQKSRKYKKIHRTVHKILIEE